MTLPQTLNEVGNIWESPIMPDFTLLDAETTTQFKDLFNRKYKRRYIGYMDAEIFIEDIGTHILDNNTRYSELLRAQQMLIEPDVFKKVRELTREQTNGLNSQKTKVNTKVNTNTREQASTTAEETTDTSNGQNAKLLTPQGVILDLPSLNYADQVDLMETGANSNLSQEIDTTQTETLNETVNDSDTVEETQTNDLTENEKTRDDYLYRLVFEYQNKIRDILSEYLVTFERFFLGFYE